MFVGPAALPNPFPLVGRATEVEALRLALDQAATGRSSITLLAGEAGVGKTRLVQAVLEQARARKWVTAVGAAYSAESGVPHALFADAFVPLLRQMDAHTVSALSRGGMAEMAQLFPTLVAGSHPSAADGGNAPEFKARMLWTFTEFVSCLARKRPLLLVLENLHCADAASLELLHFMARQVSDVPLAIVCTYIPLDRGAAPNFRTIEHSLRTQAGAGYHEVRRFTAADTLELLHQLFGGPGVVPREFAALLFGWTRGNPFFLEEVLKWLIASGRLSRSIGIWSGWNVEGLDLPPSIRDALSARLAVLSPSARTAADLAAALGARVSLAALRAISTLSRDELLAAVQELLQRRELDERAEDDHVVFDFVHPMIRETLYAELGLARAQTLHATIAEALETLYGAQATEHAGELAYHLLRAGDGAMVPKAITYLIKAGRSALATHADQEAAAYLSSALLQCDRMSTDDGADAIDAMLIADLASARQRLGEREESLRLWSRARDDAASRGDIARVAEMERRIGLAYYSHGMHATALEHYGAGLSLALDAGLDGLAVSLRLAHAASLMEMGQQARATEELRQALVEAERSGDVGLQARTHRSMLLVATVMCDVRGVREHAARALSLGEHSRQPAVSWSAHWALAAVGGMTGDVAETERHLVEVDRIADELRSPILRIWNCEIAVEFHSALGQWDTALALGEHSITLARAFGQRTLLPRLLVWTAITYVGRGNLERAKNYLDEAWEISGASIHTDAPRDVTGMLRSHIGMAIYYTAIGRYDEAIRIGTEGLAIAERTGQTIWAIYRLLPATIEAYLRMEMPGPVPALSRRLREESERVGHKLGIAWSEAADALLEVQRDLTLAAVERVEAAADQLEAFPCVFDAARLRLVVGGLRVRCGDTVGATRMLKSAFQTFSALGAEHPLARAREALEKIGVRPPRARSRSGGGGALSARQHEVALLVSQRLSNKEIAARLQLSTATVRTHVENIFRLLGIHDRGELTDLVRGGRLQQPP